MRTTDWVLVGNAAGGTLAAFGVEGDRLVPGATTDVGVGCSSFALDGDLLYCAVKEPEPAVVTLRLDHADASLTELSRTGVPDALHYVTVTAGGNVLLGASYGGGFGAAWPLRDGVLGPMTSRIDNANMHCVIASDDARFAYFASLGDDVIVPARIVDSVLEPMPAVACPSGCGPRHLVLSPDQTSLYLMTEFTAEVIRFDRDPGTGTLTQAESVPGYNTSAGLQMSRFGADPREEHLAWGADLHLSDGYLLASERTGSTIVTIALDGDRLLDQVAVTPTETVPRGFAVAPELGLVLVVGEKSDHATLYRLAEDGTLTALDRCPTGEGPNWARFVPTR